MIAAIARRQSATKTCVCAWTRPQARLRPRPQFLQALFVLKTIVNLRGLFLWIAWQRRQGHARFARGVNAVKTVFKYNVLAARARFKAGDNNPIAESGQVSFKSAEFGERGVVLGFPCHRTRTVDIVVEAVNDALQQFWWFVDSCPFGVTIPKFETY